MTKLFGKGKNTLAALTVCAALLLAAAVAAFCVPVVADAASTVDIRLTGLYSYTACDAQGRMVLAFNSDYTQPFTSADSREGSASISLSMEIDGQTFTFAAGKYVIAFGQYPAAREQFMVYLKRDKKDIVQNGVPAGFYNETYPGLATGQAHTIKFSQGMQVGKYRLAADCEVRITADDKAAFFSNPHAIAVTGGTAEGTQVWNDEVLASEGARIRIKPQKQAGYRASGLTFTDEHGEAVEVAYTSEGGTFVFDMPAYAVNVRVTMAEARYTLSVGGRSIEVYPYTKIGPLPEGNWQVDGYAISEKSLWVWSTDKTATARTKEDLYAVEFYDGDELVQTVYYTLRNTAVRYPDLQGKPGFHASWENVTLDGGNKVVHAVYTPVVYTAVFMADGNKVKEVQFTALTEKLDLPVIPPKDGFEIVGWDLDGFPTGNVIVNAIYKRIQD